MDAIVGIFTAIATAVAELLMHLMALVLSSGYLAQRNAGIIRFAYLLLALAGVYYLFGILRWLVPALATPALQVAYHPLVLCAVGLVFVFALALLIAGESHPTDPMTGKPQITGGPLLTLISYALAFLLLFGGLSLIGSQSHGRSLSERACDAARTKITADTETRITEGLDLAGKLLNRDLTSGLPCQSTTD